MPLTVIKKRYAQSKPPTGAHINWGHPLTNGLTDYWLLNDVGTRSANLVRPSHHMEHNAAVRTIPGLRGKRKRYGGSPAWSICANDTARRVIKAGSTGITYEMYIWLPSGSPGSKLWMGQASTTAFQYDTMFYYSSTGLISFYVPTVSGLAYVYQNVASTQNSHLHLVGTFDGTTPILYINGQIPASTTQTKTGTLTSTHPFNFCRMDVGAYGVIDIYYARVWNRALSMKEAQSLYRQPHEMLAPSRKIYYSSPDALPALIRKKKRYSNIKPPVGTQINWNHPISNRMVGCWLFNEGGGEKTQDLVKQNAGDFSGNVSWARTSKGVGINFADGANDLIQVNNPLLGKREITICTLVYKKSYNQFGSQYSDYWASAQKNIILGYETPANTLYFYIGDGTNVDSQTVTGFTQDVWHMVSASFRSSNLIRVGVDLNFASDTTTISNIGSTTNNAAYRGIGRYIVDSFIGDMMYMYMWDRVLSINELQELYGNPYCFLQPINRIYFTQLSAVSGPLAKAFTESISATNTLSMSFSKVLSSALSIATSIVLGNRKVLSTSITTSDTLNLLFSKVLSSAISLSDTLTKRTTKVFSDSITVTDATYILFFLALSESITAGNIISKKTTKPQSDSITVTTTLVSAFFKAISESITVTDTTVKSFFKVLSDNVTVTNTITLPALANFIRERYITARRSMTADDLRKMKQFIGDISIGDLETMARGLREIMKDWE